MANPTDLDRTFHFIMKRMVETGQAPHYTEIASGWEFPWKKAEKLFMTSWQLGNSWMAISKYGLHRFFCSVQQSSYPVSNNHRKAAEMVRSVRVRVASSLLALSREDQSRSMLPVSIVDFRSGSKSAMGKFSELSRRV